ncbi:hypothetical protein VCSRO172_2973 [Vibrio cholerae]|nr:hypothetical protein VCSRO172_2973 [Vibrio cholerae]
MPFFSHLSVCRADLALTDKTGKRGNAHLARFNLFDGSVQCVLTLLCEV